MPFQYRALEPGTLSKPFRFIEAGTIVTLDEPLATPSRWLLPLDEYKAKRAELDAQPLIPFLKPAGSRAETAIAASMAGQIMQQSQGVRDMLEAERKQAERQLQREGNGPTPPAPEAPKEEPKEEPKPDVQTEGGEGTGSQNVLD